MNKKLSIIMAPLLAITFLASCGGSKPEPETIYHYVTFVTNGGSTIEQAKVEDNKTLEKPTNPIKPGYAFDIWCTDEGLTNEYDFSHLVTEDFTLYAKWDTAYTITYHNVSDSEHSNPKQYTEDDEVTFNNANRNGYDFKGWFTDSDLTIPITKIEKGTTGNLDIYAKFEPIEYKIEYVLNGGTSEGDNPDIYTVEDTIVLKSAIGYLTFCGWHLKADLSDAAVTGWNPGDKTGKVILYAEWTQTPVEFTITYKNVSSQETAGFVTTYKGADLPLTLSTPSRTDWAFNGYYTNKTFNEESKLTNNVIPVGTTGNLTLYTKMVYKETSLDKLSWPDIKMISEKDGARATFGEPGAQTKKVTLNNSENQVRIIAYDYDKLSTSTEESPQYAGITFEFVNIVNNFTTFWNNKSGSNSKNYDFIYNSNLNDCLQPAGDEKPVGEIYKMMPTDLMSVVKTVNKKVDIHLNYSWVDGDYDTQLFPLSYDEIGGKDGSTNAYEYYKEDFQSKRAKGVNYWLRSPYTEGSSMAWFTGADGGLSHTAVIYHFESAVAPAFCI